MGEGLRRNWPIVTALLTFWGVLAFLAWQSLRLNQGHLIYMLDDPYIHSAMAKHFVQRGVWGVTPYEFSSSSSSPLWTLLLSLVFRVTGDWSDASLWLNVLCSSLIFVVTDRILRPSLPDVPRFLVLLALIFLVPLPLVVFVGMEHSLQVLVTVLLVWCVSEEAPDWARRWRMEYLFAALLVGTRYEGLLVVLILAGWLVFRREWGRAALLLGAGLVPIGLYALVSLKMGWFALPNSIVVKTQAGGSISHDPTPLGPFVAIFRLIEETHIGLLLAFQAIAFVLQRLAKQRFSPTGILWAAVFCGTAILHFSLIKPYGGDWGVRYQAAIVTLGILAAARIASELQLVSEMAKSRWNVGGLPVAARLGVVVAVALGVILLHEAVSLLPSHVSYSASVLAVSGAMGLLFAVRRDTHPVPQRIFPVLIVCILAMLAQSGVDTIIDEPVATTRFTLILVPIAAFLTAWLVWETLQESEVPVDVGRGFAMFWVTATILYTLLELSARTFLNISHIVPATGNIYRQQYQMGRFLKRYYNEQAIAVNDLGAVNYMADLHTLDLVGLSSLDVAKARLANQFNAAVLESLSTQHQCRMAIAYDNWLGPAQPASWRKVATWAIPHNVIAGNRTVTFYAIAPDEEPLLRAHLEEFRSELPAEVRVEMLPGK